MSTEQKEANKAKEQARKRKQRANKAIEKMNNLQGCINNDEKALEKVKYFDLGPMIYQCYYCSALGFEGEVKHRIIMNDGTTCYDFGSLCCCRGKVKGISDYHLPPELKYLYTDQNDPLAVHFRQHSRAYNNGMAMSSLALEKGKRWQTRAHKMESMLTANGQLIRRVGPLKPQQGERPKCVQAYFYGPDEATFYRLQNFPNIQQKERDTYTTIFKRLHDIITSAGNKYIESYMGVKDYVEKYLKDKVWDVKLSLHANESAEERVHLGRLNAPTVKEIAILLPNDISPKHERQVVFNYMKPDDESGLHTISDFHKAYDPLQYPLIFPDGQDGWHDELEHSALQHVNYMLMDREGIVNPILQGNSLGQQFIVDQWAKVEMSRLRWCKNNQKTLRAEVYSGLKDATKSDKAATDIKKAGKRVVLPSTFIGGDRYIHQQQMDALALYQRLGRPHIFATATTNPNWPEITNNLKPGQTALDQPDLVSRVFKLKKDQLIRELCSEHIFGKAIARVHSIEFQKRGFPHAHIIIWLDPEIGNHMDTTRLDEIICAEIPDKEKDPTLFEQVTSFMLHGPCGPENSHRACMQGGSGFCRFGYPKDCLSTTQLSDDGYPLYRRLPPEEGGNVFETYRNNKKVVFTNADVVPYNKYLLRRFNCHINVEYCYSIQAIKYTIKYINKGPDQATISVEKSNNAPGDTVGNDDDDQPKDEILEYQTKR